MPYIKLYISFIFIFSYWHAAAENKRNDENVSHRRPNIIFAFADDWGRYAGAYAGIENIPSPNQVVKTPAFDAIAGKGILFRNAFVPAPSCTPCRSSILSGQYFFRTGLGAILNGAKWDSAIPSFPLLLKDHGYEIGETYKVWSPGTPADAPFGAGQFAYEKAGGKFNSFSQNVTKLMAEGVDPESAKERMLSEVRGNFKSFLASRSQSENAPFLYWFGPTLVHRKWIQGSGAKLWGINPDDLQGKLPPFLPDVPEIREDFADYLGEIQAFDAGLQILIDELIRLGEFENTVIVVSGDHGAPGFPRGKCNLYDFGVGVALAICGPGIPGQRVVDDFVNLMDLAPTFLDLADVPIPEVMTGSSLAPVLHSQKSGWVDGDRDWVITGRERHVSRAREGFVPYPQRALRTPEYLFIRNFKPDRWPMGDPLGVTSESEPEWEALVNQTYVAFADMDASPAKAWMVTHRSHPEFRPHYLLGFAKRPEFELYHIPSDPHQIHNLADQPDQQKILQKLHSRLLDKLGQYNDPRLIDDGKLYESPPFTGE
ncbi:MAG: sulfatase [Verrucomicrobia bacterium]|nr:sulfatase [Verrucomicrobiota bacterium]